MNAIEIKHLHKKFGTHTIFEDAEFTVPEGKLTGIYGKSGSGKSTLLNIISGIEKAHVLRDLFDCRVCANHVAQMYLRGIMDARDLMPSEGFMWFDLDGIDDRDANVEHIRKMLDQNLNPL